MDQSGDIWLSAIITQRQTSQIIGQPCRWWLRVETWWTRWAYLGPIGFISTTSNHHQTKSLQSQSLNLPISLRNQHVLFLSASGPWNVDTSHYTFTCHYVIYSNVSFKSCINPIFKNKRHTIHQFIYLPLSSQRLASLPTQTALKLVTSALKDHCGRLCRRCLRFSVGSVKRISEMWEARWNTCVYVQIRK